MNVTFTEADGSERTWESFKPGRLMSTEAEVIEKVTGLTFSEWGQALMNGSAIAGRALIWVLKKREDPTLRFGKVDFPVEDLSVSLDSEERVKVRAELDRNPDLSEEDRAQIIAALDEEDSGEMIEPGSPGNDLVPPVLGSEIG